MPNNEKGKDLPGYNTNPVRQEALKGEFPITAQSLRDKLLGRGFEDRDVRAAITRMLAHDLRYVDTSWTVDRRQPLPEPVAR